MYRLKTLLYGDTPQKTIHQTDTSYRYITHDVLPRRAGHCRTPDLRSARTGPRLIMKLRPELLPWLQHAGLCDQLLNSTPPLCAHYLLPRQRLHLARLQHFV